MNDIPIEKKLELTTPSQHASGIGLRFLIAVILFSAFIILDSANLKIFSMDTSQLYACLLENYTLNSFAFIEEITYTLTHG